MAVGGIALTFKIRSLLSIIPMAYHRAFAAGCSIFTSKSAELCVDDAATLFVCNHTSYLDISVLGSIITGSFIAKAEVADWPVFGYLAEASQRTGVYRPPAANDDPPTAGSACECGSMRATT